MVIAAGDESRQRCSGNRTAVERLQIAERDVSSTAAARCRRTGQRTTAADDARRTGDRRSWRQRGVVLVGADGYIDVGAVDRAAVDIIVANNGNDNQDQRAEFSIKCSYKRQI